MMNLKLFIGAAALMALAACQDQNAKSENDNVDQTGRLGLMADCNDADPAVGACQVGLACQFDHCLPPAAECALSTDCADVTQRCNQQTFVCEATGCNVNGTFCTMSTFNQSTDMCDLTNPIEGCCDLDADCQLNNGPGVCNLDTHLCAQCLQHTDCAENQQCDANQMCVAVACDLDPANACVTATRNADHSCTMGLTPNCCLAGQDMTCQTACVDIGDCAGLGDGTWECTAHPGGLSYCTPAGFTGLIGCQVGALDAPAANVCAMCDDNDNDGACDPSETCGDGRDNNGNAQIDEGCPEVCVPSDETCDGIDNNCDGTTDNVLGLGEPCSLGMGDCTAVGALVCDSMNNPGAPICNAVPGMPSDEVCDNHDNDCDGTIDNILPMACYNGPNGTQHVGICHDGQTTCNAGAWSECMGEVWPAMDVCDSMDNDCDGSTDEDFPTLGNGCFNGVGACMGLGTIVCNGPADVMCNAVAGIPTPEVCDTLSVYDPSGVDEDCDGFDNPDALCDPEGDLAYLPWDNCPDVVNHDQLNVDSNPARGDACFAKISVTIDAADPAGEPWLVYRGTPENGTVVNAGEPVFLTEVGACTWGAEVWAEVGNTGTYYGCNVGAPALGAIHIQVNDVDLPNNPIGHPWVCANVVDNIPANNPLSNLGISKADFACPGPN